MLLSGIGLVCKQCKTPTILVDHNNQRLWVQVRFFRCEKLKPVYEFYSQIFTLLLHQEVCFCLSLLY